MKTPLSFGRIKKVRSKVIVCKFEEQKQKIQITGLQKFKKSDYSILGGGQSYGNTFQASSNSNVLKMSRNEQKNLK